MVRSKSGRVPHSGRDPVKRARLSDEVASYVRELIISGQLRSGEFIRPESVAEALDISATPAREGLLALQGEGFLQTEPRRGFVVAPLTGKDVSDLFVAQALLAGELAARAARAASPDDLAELEGIQAALEEAARSDALETLEQLNFAFHRTINKLANAPKMAWLLGIALRYTPGRFYATISGWPAATIEDHRGILDALLAKDAEAARDHMAAHFVHAGGLLAHHFDELGRQPGSS
jgi:DNA-binding GntR family transcriptional regulator